MQLPVLSGVLGGEGGQNQFPPPLTGGPQLASILLHLQGCLHLPNPNPPRQGSGNAVINDFSFYARLLSMINCARLASGERTPHVSYVRILCEALATSTGRRVPCPTPRILHRRDESSSIEQQLNPQMVWCVFILCLFHSVFPQKLFTFNGIFPLFLFALIHENFLFPSNSFHFPTLFIEIWNIFSFSIFIRLIQEI